MHFTNELTEIMPGVFFLTLLEQDWEVKIKNTDIVPKTMTHQAAERRIQVVHNVGLTEAPGLLEPAGTSTKTDLY